MRISHLRSRLRAVVSLAAALVLATPAAAEEEVPATPPPSEVADLELFTVEGLGPISTGSYRGKKLLLIEFASW